MQVMRDLGVNILAAIISPFLLGTLAYLILRFRLRRFHDFFGISKSPKLRVYLSNLWRRDIAAIYPDPWAMIISGREFPVTKTINDLFTTAPFSLPDIARSFVDGIYALKRVNIMIEPSPLEEGELDFNSNIIIIGATTKNLAREVLKRRNMIGVVITGEPNKRPDDNMSNPLSNTFTIVAGDHSGQVWQEEGDFSVAIIEKIVDRNGHGHVIFNCVGYRGDDSWRAAHCLAKNWEHLYKKYNTNSFALCLWFKSSMNNRRSYECPVKARDAFSGEKIPLDHWA